MEIDNSNKVSIIIPHYNRISLLKETIASIEQQSYTNWELIIVDDGSDETNLQELSSLRENKKISIINRQSSFRGPSVCRNIGAREATGKYLLFLDSDDLLAPYCLSQRMRAMDEVEVDLAIFKMEEFQYTPGDVRKVYNKLKTDESDIALFLQNDNSWNVTCPLWSRNFFLSLGGFDEELLAMEDPEIHIRALLAKASIKKHYHLNVDSYYRINHFDNTKQHFYFNSIHYRIVFFKKVWNQLNLEQRKLHKKDVRKGIMLLLNNFLLSRINNYPNLFRQLIEWLEDTAMFSSKDLNNIRFAGKLFGMENNIVRSLRLKGLYKRYLLPTA